MIGEEAEIIESSMRCLSLDGSQPGDSVYGLCLRSCRITAELPVLPASPQPWPKVSVVIPTLNEARNLPHVFAKLPAGLHEVIVVDGNSVDDTVATARRLRPDIRIVMQNRSGKGNALACGFAAATGDIIAMVDADGSADPAEIPQFVKALLDGADFAKGTRFADGGGSSDITRLRRIGNRMLQRPGQHAIPDQVLRSLLRLQRLLAASCPGVRPRRRDRRPGRRRHQAVG